MLIQLRYPATVMAGLIVVLGSACSEYSLSPTPAPPSAALALASMSSCGASFRMISSEHDALMDQYGLPPAVDTVDVCEDWNGSDYTLQAVAVGSSENIPGSIDTVQTVTYQGGYVSGYSANGAASADPTSVGPTAFDYLQADNATRQASYDDPYYGISSPDPNACTQEPCLDMLTGANLTQSPQPARTSGQTAVDTLDIPTPNFVRHGLSRRGVRALVDDAVEIAPSIEGYRQFRTVLGPRTIVRGVHPTTELLMTEELSEPQGNMRVVHAWMRVPGGYVRSHSEYSTVEQINGREIKGGAKIAFQNVQVSRRALPSPSSTPVTP